jgi:phage tail sheath protein FI
MAEQIVSPGVFTRENDLSFVQPAPVEAGTAFVGPTVKGPVEQPTVVTSYNEFTRKFGAAFESGSTKQEFLTSLAVKNFFSQGGSTALITRVTPGSFTAAENTNIASSLVVGSEYAAGSSTIAAVAEDNDEFRIVNGSSTYRFIASGNPIPADDVDGDVYFFTTGSTATETAANLVAEVNANIPTVVSASNTAAVFELSGSAAGTAYNGIVFSTGSGASFSTQFTLAGGADAASTSYPFTLETLGKGIIYNNSTGATDAGAENSDGSLVSGSADNLRWEISNVDSAKGTFSLSIRRGDDSTNNKVILESFNNLSLDPNASNYIENVIGNQYTTISTDGTSKFVTTVGEYVNKSNYIRVAAVNLPTLNYLANDGVTVNTDTNGVSYASSLPSAQSGSFHSATGNIVVAGMALNNDLDGSAANAQGLAAADYSNAVAVLSNKDDFQFNVLVTPGLIYENSNFTSTVQGFITLVEDRGDAIYVPDLVGYGSTIANVATNAAALNSSYAASYWPWLKLRSETGKNVWAPASVVIPGVFASNDNASAPWFAPAGLVRGGIPGVLDVEKKLPRTSRDTIYSGKVNPIASFPGAGLAVFGQKTLQTKATALDRVNVRRLLIELKKEVANVARNLVFEQNTITTRNRFLARVNPYLESVVQQQGLYSYRVVMDDRNNTADVIDRNQLIGQIYIQPAKTAEFVVLDFSIEPTGATFGA